MLWKASDLKEFSLRARDGEIGNVDDFYFSDDNWTIRYIVVGTGDWLDLRKVLVSPMALELPPNAPAKLLPVNVTRAQVRDAPSVDTKLPVSRHYENRYCEYYGWPYYWMRGMEWGPFFTPSELARAGTAPESIEPPDDPHLRSANEAEGYRFEGRDGKFGHIEDFIISDESWAIRYLEIATRNWLPGGKKVLLPTRWASEVHWGERVVRAEVSRDAVESAPDYDESEPVTEAVENALTLHYRLDRPPASPR